MMFSEVINVRMVPMRL